MNILGLIAEYNPFHYGHKYHLEESLSKTNTDYSVAVMSGSFVQRGEPSFIDKWTKAKMAVGNGVDLVLELPSIYSSQSAELFALGAVKLLNSLNIVDYLSFGSEIGDLEPLEIISKVLLEEPTDFKTNLAYNLSLGYSFPVSRSLALEVSLKDTPSSNRYDFKNILKQSNNILGIEYIKALSNIKSDIKAITIKRKGSDYKDKNINSDLSSATAIRETILKIGIEASKDLIPLESFLLLEEYSLKYGKFNTLENYSDLIRYLFLTTDKETLKTIFDIDEGLENRIIKFVKKSNSIQEIISSISTKRYPSTRIQRIFTHLLLNLNERELKELYSYEPQYVRVLAANQKGLNILNKIKKNSNIKIITKFSNYKKYNNEIIDRFLYFETKATDIYFLGLDLKAPLVSMDYYVSPFIKQAY